MILKKNPTNDHPNLEAKMNVLFAIPILLGKGQAIKTLADGRFLSTKKVDRG